MFTDILEKKKLNEIIKIYKKGDKEQVDTIVIKVINEVIQKYNKIVFDLVLDTTLFRFWKLYKKMKYLQEGYKQLGSFYNWIYDNFEEKEIQDHNKNVVDILSFLEKGIIRKKEHMIVIFGVIASWGTIILAIIAITISLIFGIL